MFHLHDLTRPVVVAPMAGDASTPELVAAAAEAGGIGFLAAGYRSVDDVLAQVDRTRELGAQVFGVNLFVAGEPCDLEAARGYRERMLPLAQHLGVELPEPRDDDDAYELKCEAILAHPVPAVSFTFGCPSGELVERFRRVGTATIATVTSAAEAARAAAAGVDALVVQGPDAGGHQATFDARAEPPTQPLPELLRAVRAVTDIPRIATGGLGTPEAVRAALQEADAVQLGTALLDAQEAGTSPTYRRGLRDPRYTQTVLTRAFSGRWARGLRNSFIEAYGPDAPASYPAVNQLTGGIRRAATLAGDHDNLSLWAGTSWRTMPTGTTAAIIDGLLGGNPKGTRS